MGLPTELGRCVTAWKRVSILPKGLRRRERKVGGGFFFH